MSVIGDRAECDTGAKRHTAAARRPLFETCYADRGRAVIPVSGGSKRVPLLTRSPFWLHIERKQPGHAVHAETSREKRNDGRKLGRQVEREISLPISYSEDRGSIDLHLQRN